MEFSIKEFSSKCDHIRSFLRIWWQLLKNSLMENFIFYAVWFNLLQNNIVSLKVWVLTLNVINSLKVVII